MEPTHELVVLIRLSSSGVRFAKCWCLSRACPRGRCAKGFTSLISLNSPQPQANAGSITISPFQMKMQKHREVNELAEGHSASGLAEVKPFPLSVGYIVFTRSLATSRRI